MRKVIAELEIELVKAQKRLDYLRRAIDEARGYSDEDKAGNGNYPLQIAASALPNAGVYDGMKTGLAIVKYLKSRGNPGVSEEEIVNALIADGSVLSGKKYPKRSVSLAIVNSPDVFVKKNGLVYLLN